MDANEKVLEILKSAGKPMKGNELAEQSGLDRKAVDKALKELKKQGLIASPKVCYYAAVN